MQTHIRRWEPVLMVALGLWVLLGWRSSAEAVLTIRSAEVINGAAVVQGGKAPANAPISWEGMPVTQANKGGNFAFQGMVPADCVGRLEDGVPADAVDVALANCTPVPPPPEFPAPVPQTGQTTSEVVGDDGDVQAGVSWPAPRFTDNQNGTVTDHLTGLIWLKDAACGVVAQMTWYGAVDGAHRLADGLCGLTDGSVVGDWHLANVKELQSLVDFGASNPALPPGHLFGRVQISNAYWTSTARADNASLAWYVFLGVTDCNRNRAGLQSARFRDHIIKKPHYGVFCPTPRKGIFQKYASQNDEKDYFVNDRCFGIYQTTWASNHET
jgi:Protein of unknown function (DUF1566)